MAVTPKGIVTPDASSPYNLITDLNTLASTTDAAIAAQKGTASQRTAALAGAPDGTLWQDTNGIKMIWRKDGSVWVPAVWRWAGTTAQMNAFTQAPNGFEWFNTSAATTYYRLSGAWVGSPGWVQVPVTGTSGPGLFYRIDSGRVDLRFDLTFSTAVPSAGTRDPLVILPGTVPRPAGDAPISIAGQGARVAVGFVRADGAVIFRNEHSQALSRFFAYGSWLIN